ncbi:L-2-amino-thiazoline-4-carboxylic acid hydrolase [Janthinobacterium sp. MDB2-8]|uniref:L-2-amino-thiazoline-4-carboxylic acid hydrolase n=1 Tax=Janthinobacterium sp. MDB2-8 TaxID=1259338 RepID=UPI003F266A6D
MRCAAFVPSAHVLHSLGQMRACSAGLSIDCIAATESHQLAFPEDFIYDFVAPGPADNLEFGINYRACGFCKFAQQHEDKEILPNICGLDCVAYTARGIHMERTQTLAGGASHCNFRFSRQRS